MREEGVKKNLKEVKEVFDKYDLKVWLDWGTLLGAVREGGVIDWDHDIDLGTTDKLGENIESVAEDFRNRGFYVRVRGQEKFRVNETLKMHRSSCAIGFNAWSFSGRYAWFGGNNFSGGTSLSLGGIRSVLLHPQEMDIPSKARFKFLRNILSLIPFKARKPFGAFLEYVRKKRSDKYMVFVVPRRFFENMDTIEFYGVEFSVPSPVEKHLELHYGEDWRTPKKDWQYWRDDGAVFLLDKDQDLESILNKNPESIFDTVGD